MDNEKRAVKALELSFPGLTKAGAKRARRTVHFEGREFGCLVNGRQITIETVDGSPLEATMGRQTVRKAARIMAQMAGDASGWCRMCGGAGIVNYGDTGHGQLPGGQMFVDGECECQDPRRKGNG